MYLRARWYNPTSGVFLSRDPFGGFATRPYSLHPYQYGYANPVVWTDASGRVVGVATLGGAVLLGGASLATAALIAAPVLLVGSVYAFNLDARRDLARGARAAWTAPGASLAVVAGMSPAEEAFGPPHTGHQEVVPPDLHPHAPLPPPIPVVPDIPMAGGVSEPAETGCPHRLGGFTLLSPSWQDNIRANPLPAQQTATVLASSTLLDKRLGGSGKDERQAHHLIPQQFRTHDFVLRATRAGWDHDQVYNGILLPETLPLSQQHNVPQHRGSHPAYNDKVLSKLDDLELQAQAGNWSDQQANNELKLLAEQMKRDIQNAGGGHRLK